jgi:DNA-directed RNA polymerase specialized sigma24 family protein
MDDRTLVDRMLAATMAAFGEFFDMYFPFPTTLYRLRDARRLAERRRRAVDVVQATLVRAVRGLVDSSEATPRSSTGAVHQVCRRGTGDYSRRAGHKHPLVHAIDGRLRPCVRSWIRWRPASTIPRTPQLERQESRDARPPSALVFLLPAR